jgi:hypothetical protein
MLWEERAVSLLAVQLTPEGLQVYRCLERRTRKQIRALRINGDNFYFVNKSLRNENKL